MAGWFSRFPRTLSSLAVVGALSVVPASGQSTGIIDGTVVDAADGQPIAGAQIFIEALSIGTLTNPEGRYSIANVPAGSHEFSARIVGYLTATEDVTVSDGQVTTVDLRLNFTALELDELVVTGTSAQVSATELPYSVSVVARRKLEEQGSPQVVEFFKALSSSHGVVGERQSWYNANEVAAVPETVANVNLRGLGGSRTLVLLNGRRQVYLPARLIGGRYVDINAFPSIAIDRIEVLKEGASAIYGSDAVAGVANFLTRGDFEGMEMTASHEYFAGAGDTNVGGIWGRRLGSSTNAVVSAEWMTRQQLTPQERDWALHPYISGAGAWSGTGNPGAFLMPSLTGSESSGELISQLADAHLSDDDIFIDPRCLEFGGFQESKTCRFRYQPWDNLLEQSNHFRAFAEINGELGDNSSYHIEGLWAEAVTPAWVTTPSFPPIKPYDGLQIVPAENPGRQAFCQQHGSTVEFMSSAHCLEDDWYFFGRLVGHSGPGRTLERKSRTQRLSASWDGGVEVLEGHDNRLNLALSYSRSSGNVNQPAEYAYRKYLAFRGYGGRDCGVDVVADPSSSSGMSLGPTGGRVPGQGNCKFYNPFSNALQYSQQPGARFVTEANPDYSPELANDPEMLAWINEQVDVESFADMLVADATLTGSKGPAENYALGYQFRRFDVSSTPNDPGNLNRNPCSVLGSQACLEQAGPFTFTTGTYPYDAAQTLHRFFAELPLHGMDERLHLQLAANYEYHSVASSFNPKAAFRLGLTDQFALRGSLQTTFRTPSVDDLNESRTTALAYVNEAGVYKAVDTHGDKQLKSEQALTYNAGVVVTLADQAGFVPVQLTADYWSYDFENVIAVVPYNAVTRLYHQGGSAREAVQSYVTCSDGRGTGTCDVTGIERIDVDLINWPGVKTSGFDVQLTARSQVGSGIVNAGLEATYTNKFSIEALNVEGVELMPDTEGAGGLNKYNPIAPPLPSLKGRLFGSYGWADYSVVGYLNYISSYTDHDEAGSEYEHIDSFVTLDATALWRPSRGIGISLSLLNLTDVAPPFVKWEQSFDGYTHSAKGRRIKLPATYRRF